MRALSDAKGRLDSVDARLVATQQTVRTRQDFPKLVAAEKKALPSYRTVLRAASQGQASTTDSDLQSGWSSVATSARLRIHGASVVIAAFRGTAITGAQTAAMGRVSKQVDAQNRRWKTIATRLNSRFGSC